MQPAFLRSLDAAGLLTPNRSAGGQRRYSRAELTLAARVRELLDQNMPLTAATRIVSLEHQLAAAHQHIADLEHTTSEPNTDPATINRSPRFNRLNKLTRVGCTDLAEQGFRWPEKSRRCCAAGKCCGTVPFLRTLNDLRTVVLWNKTPAPNR